VFLSKLFPDFLRGYQFTNVIFHENMHILTKKGSEQFPCDHAKLIYLEQIKHTSFSKCSYEYKTGMIGSITCYLVKSWGDSEFAGGGFANVSKIVDELNSEIKKYGLGITMKDNGPAGFECKLKILKTNAFSPINCSDYEEF